MLGSEVISSWVFFKYSLGGDTTTPSGLYARLCHTFLVVYYIINNQSPVFCRTCLAYGQSQMCAILQLLLAPDIIP